MLARMLRAFVVWSDVIFAERQTDSRTDQSGRCAIEISFPVSFRPENRAVVQTDIFVNKNIAFVRQIIPDITNTRFERKFEINIEGTRHPWDRDTITVPELRELGALPTDTPVVEVDLQTNTERTLAEDEVVHLKPGQGFGRKVRFQRG